MKTDLKELNKESRKFLIQLAGKVEMLEKEQKNQRRVMKYMWNEQRNPPEKTINDFVKLLEERKIFK